MNAYIINLLIIIAIYFLTKLIKDKEKRNKVFLYISFIQLFLFLALRSIDVGRDLPNYINLFNKCIEYNISSLLGFRYEKGYILYNFIIARIFKSSQIFLVITALISMLGPFYIIKKYSKNYFLSIFIYVTFQFFIFTFSGLRQAIALSLLLLSIKFIEERKIFKFLIMIILATFFHMSAFLFIIMYFISNIKVNNKKLLILIIVAIILTIIGSSIINNILKKIYIDYSNIESNGGYTYFTILCLTLIIASFVKTKFFKEKGNILWYNMLIVAILFQILALKCSIISRLNLYYTISVIIIIPNILHCFKDKKIKLIGEILIIIALFLYFIPNANDTNIYPIYRLFLNQ